MDFASESCDKMKTHQRISFVNLAKKRLSKKIDPLHELRSAAVSRSDYNPPHSFGVSGVS